MGIVASWLTGCLFPEEQAIWHAANVGDHRGLHDAIAALTPSTRRYLEWKDPCSGRTPLAQSAAKGRLPCVVALVDAGVNVNAKDYKGNTPLHLASRHGRVEIVKYLVNLVQVVPFEANMELQTPLDVARDRLRRRKGCDDHHSASSKQVVGYEGCIAELEKKFYLYSGWVYEKTDNLLSSVSGISNLSSWKHRFCIVLQRGLPDVLELALFAARKGDMRPALPSSVVLYHVQSGFLETTDSKWFNRKDYAFSITGSVLQRDGHCEERRRAAPTQKIELAAIDAEGFHMWSSFLQHQQAMLAAARLHHGELPTVYASTCGASAAPAPATAALPASPLPPLPAVTDYRAYPADYVAVPRHQSQYENNSSTMSTLRDDAAEDEDLCRAIELSLRETSTHETSSPPRATTTMHLESSAPAWTDDECDDGEEQKEEAAAQHQPVVSFSRAPSYSSIGECVVCFDGPQAAVCVPCGHNAVCMSCAEEILETSCECPVCRHPIRELIKLYRV